MLKIEDNLYVLKYGLVNYCGPQSTFHNEHIQMDEFPCEIFKKN